MNINLRLFLLLLVITNLAACASLTLESPKSVNLTGKWVLNSELSQDVIFPVAKSNSGGRSDRKVGGQGRGGGEHGGQGRPGGNKDGKKGRSSNNGTKGPQKAPDSAVAIEMTIEHVSGSMGVLYQSGNYRDVDWGTTEHRNRTITAGWRDESLVIKTKSTRGTIVEVYQILNDGSQLEIQFEVDGQRYLRIYDRVDEMTE